MQPSTTSTEWQVRRQVGKLDLVPRPPRYRVGDRVMVRFGARDVVAEVIEDRGPIGHGGEQIVRVSMPLDDDETFEFEVSASRASPADSSQATNVAP